MPFSFHRTFIDALTRLPPQKHQHQKTFLFWVLICTSSWTTWQHDYKFQLLTTRQSSANMIIKYLFEKVAMKSRPQFYQEKVYLRDPSNWHIRFLTSFWPILDTDIGKLHISYITELHPYLNLKKHATDKQMQHTTSNKHAKKCNKIDATSHWFGQLKNDILCQIPL